MVEKKCFAMFCQNCQFFGCTPRLNIYKCYYFMQTLVGHNSMCSLVVSVLDSPAVDPRSNPGSGSALLMSEKSQAVYYSSSCHMLIDKALSSDKPNGHWFEADWLHCKRDALSSNRKVDGSRLTGSTQACHS